MKLFGILLHGRCLFFPMDLFSRLFVPMWIHGYLLYTWVIVQYYCSFVAEIIPALVIGSSVSWLLGTQHTSLLWIFLSTFSPPRCSSSFCHFPACPRSRISHFSEKPCVYNILSQGKLHSGSQLWILIIPF